jgi:hypothetical protein
MQKCRKRWSTKIFSLKALTDHLEGGREYTHSICRLGCRLITSKVTLTGQSHFMLIFVLRKVTLRDYTNSVQLNVRNLVQKILWFN